MPQEHSTSAHAVFTSCYHYTYLHLLSRILVYSSILFVDHGPSVPLILGPALSSSGACPGVTIAAAAAATSCASRCARRRRGEDGDGLVRFTPLPPRR